MKQIFFTALGTWITIAAAMGLTADSTSPPHEEGGPPPIVQFLNAASPAERGAGIHLELKGVSARFSRESGANKASLVTVTEWAVECRPRDYRRKVEPFSENVSAYLDVSNEAGRTLTGMEITLQFLNRSGYVMHEERIETSLNVPPGQTGERIRFWYAENNEFASNDPYDIISALVTSGSLQVNVLIRKATYWPG